MYNNPMMFIIAKEDGKGKSQTGLLQNLKLTVSEFARKYKQHLIIHKF